MKTQGFLSDEDLGVTFPTGLIGASVVCFASAVGAPVFVYFRAEQVGGSRVAAAFVASLVLLAMAWICTYLLKEVELPGPDWRKLRSNQGLLAIGGLASLGGAWLLIFGHWGGIVLALFGTGLVSTGLWTLHTFLATKRAEQAGGSPGFSDGLVVEGSESVGVRMGLMAGRFSGLRKRGWVTGIALIVGFIVVITVVDNATRLGSTGVWIVVLAIFDVFLAWAVLPRFWRWREARGRLARKENGMKRFGWRWFDQGFLASAGVILAALMAIKWYRGDTHWALELAAFVLVGVFVALGYEGVRRILWAPFLGEHYSRVLVCSHCDSEADVWDMACQRCGARFMQDEWPSQH